MPLGKYISSAEVCDLLRISRLTLKRMVKAKKLTPIIFTYRRFFKKSDIDKYISQLPVDSIK